MIAYPLLVTFEQLKGCTLLSHGRFRPVDLPILPSERHIGSIEAFAEVIDAPLQTKKRSINNSDRPAYPGHNIVDLQTAHAVQGYRIKNTSARHI